MGGGVAEEARVRVAEALDLGADGVEIIGGGLEDEGGVGAGVDGRGAGSRPRRWCRITDEVGGAVERGRSSKGGRWMRIGR